MKIILTDIDDTLLKFAEPFQNWTIEKKGFDYLKFIRDCSSIDQAINCKPEDIDPLILEFSHLPRFLDLPPEPCAQHVLPVLHRMGYQFVAISACLTSPTIAAGRRRNLERCFGVPFIAVHCIGLHNSKTEVLSAYEPTLWVEDNRVQALAGAAVGHETLLLDRVSNRSDAINLTRIKDWHAVLEAAVRRDSRERA